MTRSSEIEELRKKVGDHQFHHVECDAYRELKISLSDRGMRHPEMFHMLAISSELSIAEGLKACKKSPFKTVFVVREKTGEVLYALSQNEEYVQEARKKKKKKKPKPTPVPVPEPKTDCCKLCGFMGGSGCDDLGDGSCICFGADRGIGGMDDALETMSPY